MTPPSRRAQMTNVAGASSVPVKMVLANIKEIKMEHVIIDLETLGNRARQDTYHNTLDDAKSQTTYALQLMG